MAKPGRLPDFRKMYPEASEEVIEVLKETERKMQYQEYDLKAEQTIIDQDAQEIRVIPSREDSYERLLEEHNLPADEQADVENIVLRKILTYEFVIDSQLLLFLSVDHNWIVYFYLFYQRVQYRCCQFLHACTLCKALRKLLRIGNSGRFRFMLSFQF